MLAVSRRREKEMLAVSRRREKEMLAVSRRWEKEMLAVLGWQGVRVSMGNVIHSFC
ncbi:hypothetical protein [Xanthomonas dyei]|nr:hypothetical protein [Xanthomonas dyei]